MSFEWRTDEDEGWSEDGRPKQTAVAEPFLRRRWRFLLAVLVGLAAVWLAVQWQINQRVETATAEIETELLATHNFVLQTAVNRDEDLFRANLSGRDPGWGEVQKSLLNEGLLLDRPMLVWQHQPSQERLTREQVVFTVAPDLRSAELRYPQEYAITLPDGVTETVTLQQTAVYREGDTRWLFSPPLEDFWGEWVTLDEGALRLAYPERDQEVAVRLAVDLAALLDQMCMELADLQCGSDLRVQLRLDTDPQSLIAINDSETILESGLRLELPAPTLVGLPTDEASYDVLFRAYGVALATAVLAHQSEYDSCCHELFFRALRDYQLAQLGLQAWPLEAAMYGQILSGGFDGNALRHWTRRWEEAPPQFLQVWVVEEPDPIWQQVYMLIEFLNEQETAVSPTEMIRLMNRNSYVGWIGDVLPGIISPFPNILDRFETQFIDYIYEQSIGGQQAEPPIPLPDGEITAVCTDYQLGEDSRVYAYDLAAGSWQEKLTNLDLSPAAHIRTEDGQHFIVNESSYEDSLVVNRFYLATEEELVFLEETVETATDDHFVYYDILSLEAGNKLFRYDYNQGEIQIALRSLDCPNAGCPETQISGFMTFSPDGLYIIEHVPVDRIRLDAVDFAKTSFETTLVALDGEFKRPLGIHGVVSWLNNDQYGFVQENENGWQIFAATISDSDFQPLLGESDIQAAIADDVALASPNFHMFPGTNDLILFVEGLADGAGANYLFRIWLGDDLRTIEQVELLWVGDFSSIAGLSPDGRYLALADFDPLSSRSQIAYQLLDLETLEMSSLRVTLDYGAELSWSSDGHWFLQNSNTYFLLNAPAYNYQYYIPNGLGNCQQVFLSPAE